jgi:hypothetical protein
MLGWMSPPWQTATAGSHVSATAIGATMIPAATPVAARSAAAPDFVTRMTVPSPRRISAIDPRKIPPLNDITCVF